MTAALNPTVPDRRRSEAVRLYRDEGLTLREVAERLGAAPSTVYRDLLQAGVPMRKAARHLRAVPDARVDTRPSLRGTPIGVPPERAAIAFTAVRGWHMTAAPPGWFLEMLSELT